MYKSKYNDLDLVYDKDIYKKLRENDVDDLLARHISHLFIRDPLVIFKELLDQDDEKSMDHFEVCFYYCIRTWTCQLKHVVALEYPIDQLADCTIQASTTWLWYWMACRVPQHGSTAYRFWECCLFGVYRAGHTCDFELWIEPLYPHYKGKQVDHALGIDGSWGIGQHRWMRTWQQPISVVQL